MEKFKKEIKIKGITLVALVVTIVVLIILATISINIIFGEEGIIERTKQAKQDTANAQAEEQQLIAEASNSMEQHIAGERETVTITKEEYEALKKKGEWELLATSTTTTQTEYEVNDLSKYNSVILLVYNSNDLTASTEASYEIFKKMSENQRGIFAMYNNGTPYIGGVKYVSDTKVKLFCMNTDTAKVELYGIY